MQKVIQINGVPHVSVAHLIAERHEGGAGCTDQDGRRRWTWIADSCREYYEMIEEYESKLEMWNRKFSHLGLDFLDDIYEKGIKTPICYWPEAGNGLLRNGHHRVVCAWLLGIEYLPFTENKVESDHGGPRSYSGSCEPSSW